MLVTRNDKLLLTLILSYGDNPLQQKPDAVLLFLVDFLVHKSNKIGTYQMLGTSKVINVYCSFLHGGESKLLLQ